MLTNNQLKRYLHFFEDDTIIFFKDTSGYIEYHKTLDKFIYDCEKLHMMDREYLENLEEYIGKGIELKELIEIADIKLLKSILTYYIRGERFCEGMIAAGFKDDVFRRILIRLLLLQNCK